MVELEKVACSNCGAPLEIPDSVSFVTCNHCSTQLSIQRTESVSYTEKLEQVAAGQQELNARLIDLERQNKLAALARNWDRQQKQFEVVHNGKASLPNEAAGIFAMVFGAVGGAFVAIVFPGPMKMFGLLFAAVGIGSGLLMQHRAQAYSRARRKYTRARKEILSGRQDTNINELLQHAPTPGEYLKRLESEEL